MPCRKIASNCLWTPEGFIRYPLITVAEDGRIVSVAVCDEPDRSPCTEFYAGVLTPAFIDAGGLISPDGTQTGLPAFWCFRPSTDPNALLTLTSLGAEGPAICVGADPAATDPHRSMLEALRLAGAVPLTVLLGWASWNGAQALGISGEAGSVMPGKKCGLCILSGLDYERMVITYKTEIAPIL